ncbi:MAG: hypothetical protein ABI068_18100 [Ktedonobacterales bacterium]
MRRSYHNQHASRGLGDTRSGKGGGQAQGRVARWLARRATRVRNELQPQMSRFSFMERSRAWRTGIQPTA